MIYTISFIINGKGFKYKVEAETEQLATQKFLQLMKSKIVSVEAEQLKEGNGIMDFLNGFKR